MPNRFRAVAVDLDAASLLSLREAFPDWVIEAVSGATAASLSQDWNPGAADLLVLSWRARKWQRLSASAGFLPLPAVAQSSPGSKWRKPSECAGANRARHGGRTVRFSS